MGFSTILGLESIIELVSTVLLLPSESLNAVELNSGRALPLWNCLS